MPNRTSGEDRDSWQAYRVKVLDTMVQLGDEIDKVENWVKEDLASYRKELERKIAVVDQTLRDLTVKTTEDIATLKAKAAIVGSLAGLAAGVLSAVGIELIEKVFLK